jgi:hypothetical protein
MSSHNKAALGSRLPTWIAAVVAIIPLQGTHANEMPDCEKAAAIVEQDAGLPLGLLQAIGRVESGRWDAVHGQLAGWPLSVNAGSVGRQFSNRDEAVTYVQDQLASGRRLIDVGCFQIDMFYHPDVFADGRDVFDPNVNAVAASRILQDLHARTGDWNQAVALYHSADPARGTPYLQAVLRSWAGRFASSAVVATPPDHSDPFTILVSTRASAVAVWAPTEVPDRPARRRSGLPVVITP